MIDDPEERALIESDIDDLDDPAGDEEPDLPCDLCLTLWPAGALQGGVCPDCLDEDEEAA